MKILDRGERGKGQRSPARGGWIAALLALAFGGLVLAGCGGGDDSSGTTSGGGSSSKQLAKVSQQVENLFSAKGTYESPPTTAPKPEPGKNIWLISCGQAFVACIGPMTAAEEATEALGWKHTLFDTKGDTTTASTGIRRAIADGADGIYAFYLDCRYMKAGLEAADKAGIPVVAAQSADCSDTSPGEDSLFDYVSTYTGGLNGPYPDKKAPFSEWVADWGGSMALWAVDHFEGEAHALIYQDNYGYGSVRVAEGAKRILDECEGCSADIEVFPVELLEGNGMRQRVQQDLLKNPDVNVIIPTYDAITIAGMAEAAQSAANDVVVVEGEGTTAGTDFIRNGDAAVGSGMALEWDSYSALDALNRIFHDQQPVSTGVGIQLFDSERNTPPSGPYQPPFDYAKIFKQAWGAS